MLEQKVEFGFASRIQSIVIDVCAIARNDMKSTVSKGL